MEKIRINSGNVTYDIQRINKLPDGTLEIVFADIVPKEFGDIEVYTSSDVKYADLPGYSQLVRTDGKTVWLAAVPDEPAEDEPDQEPVASLEERMRSTEEKVQAIEQQIFSSI